MPYFNSLDQQPARRRLCSNWCKSLWVLGKSRQCHMTIMWPEIAVLIGCILTMSTSYVFVSPICHFCFHHSINKQKAVLNHSIHIFQIIIWHPTTCPHFKLFDVKACIVNCMFPLLGNSWPLMFQISWPPWSNMSNYLPIWVIQDFLV